MHYEINVSKHGIHYFATAERSLTTLEQAEALYEEFLRLFPVEDGYRLSMTAWEKTGEVVHDSDKVPHFDKIFSDFRKYFEGRFHNTLWQVMKNGAGRGGAFYLLADGQLVIADPNGGYSETTSKLKGDFAVEGNGLVVKELNRQVFSLDEDQVYDILRKSMRAELGLSNE